VSSRIPHAGESAAPARESAQNTGMIMAARMAITERSHQDFDQCKARRFSDAWYFKGGDQVFRWNTV